MVLQLMRTDEILLLWQQCSFLTNSNPSSPGAIWPLV